MPLCQARRSLFIHLFLSRTAQRKPSGCSQLSQAPGAAQLFPQTLWPPGAQQTDGLWSGRSSHGHTRPVTKPASMHRLNAPRVQPSILGRMQRMQTTEHVAISLPTSNVRHPLGDKVRGADKPRREHEHKKGGRRARSTGLRQLSNAVPRSALEAPLSLKEAIIEKVTL